MKGFWFIQERVTESLLFKHSPRNFRRRAVTVVMVVIILMVAMLGGLNG